VTLVLLTAIGTGVGLVGVIVALRRRTASLDGILAGLRHDQEMAQRLAGTSVAESRWRVDHQLGVFVATTVWSHSRHRHDLAQRLALCGVSLEQICTRCVLGAMVGAVLPLVMWGVVSVSALHLSTYVPLWVSLLAGIGGALVPIVRLAGVLKQRRRHSGRVICVFLDLVILGLAGGMGIEGALLAAAELGESDLSRQMFAALCAGRESGDPPWTCLARLGDKLGIDELGELAGAAALAGTEGAKVRATLAARVDTIRRHELAKAEAEANAITERLFMPGVLLLVGFLLFVGYPAFARIVSGL